MRGIGLPCRTLACLALSCLALAALPVPSADAARVVSLNLCADDYLMLLAPEQAAALSPLSRDPALSVVADAARAVRQMRADAEAVLELKPDLVLAGEFGARTTLALLERRGLRVIRLGFPTNFDAVRTQTRDLAATLGVPRQGELLIAEMDALLSGRPRAPTGAVALLLQPRGYTSGPGSLGHEVLLAAGLRDGGSGKRVGLEALATRPPDLLVVSEPADYPSIATDFLRHPAISAIARRTLPPALLICAGPWSARAVELLAR